MLRRIREDSDPYSTGEAIIDAVSVLERWRHLPRLYVVQRVQMESGHRVLEHLGSERYGGLKNSGEYTFLIITRSRRFSGLITSKTKARSE